MMFTRAALLLLLILSATDAGRFRRSNGDHEMHGEVSQLNDSVKVETHSAENSTGTSTTPRASTTPVPGSGQTYHRGCERAVNKHINDQLTASLAYVALAAHSDRADVSLPGFKAMFLKASEYKWQNAMKLIEYQNIRLANVKFFSLMKPAKDTFSGGLEAVKMTLATEKKLYTEGLKVYQLARMHHDGHLKNFLQTNLLATQPGTIKELTGYITMINKLGGAMGEYKVDKRLGRLYGERPQHAKQQENQEEESPETSDGS